MSSSKTEFIQSTNKQMKKHNAYMQIPQHVKHCYCSEGFCLSACETAGTAGILKTFVKSAVFKTLRHSIPMC